MSRQARLNLARVAIAVMAVAVFGGIFVISSNDGSAEPAAQTVRTTTTSTTPPTTTTTVDLRPVKAWIDATNRQHFFNVLKLQEAVRLQKAEAARQAAAERERERQEALEAQQAAPTTQAPAPAPVAEQGTGRCGGDLPPCYVMMRESGGNIRAQNPSSTASGKWQFLDSTWAGYGGYAKARYAPESVQDAKARLLWAGGAGCSHWSACG